MPVIDDAIRYCAEKFEQASDHDLTEFRALINRSQFRIANRTLYIWCQGEHGNQRQRDVEAQFKTYLTEWLTYEYQARNLWQTQVTHQQPNDSSAFQQIPALSQGEQATQQHYTRPGFR